jgi:hypothetical protein
VERYRNERNIELLCEEQRFYDARRWMIAPETLGQKVRIIVINGKLKPGKNLLPHTGIARIITIILTMFKI